MLEAARKTWKQLILMEDAMLIHRVMRAPEKRVFKIDVGNIAPNEVDAHMEQVINQLRKVPFMDDETGNYNLKFNLQNMLEDFFLPHRGGQSSTEIETLPGMEWTGIDDIEYLRNKMMAALKIPKAFLGYDEMVGSKATLAAEDVRFARTIERIQRIIVSELTKIAIIHLYAQGFTNMDLVDFSIGLTTSSTVYEMEKIELWRNKIELASETKQNHVMPMTWIYENLFNMSEDQIKLLKKKIIEDAKFEAVVDALVTGDDPTKSSSFSGGGDKWGEDMTSEFDDEELSDEEGNLEDLPTGEEEPDEVETEPVAAEEPEVGRNPKPRKMVRNNFQKDFKERAPFDYRSNGNNGKNVRSFNGKSPLAMKETLKRLGLELKTSKGKQILSEIDVTKDTFLDEKGLNLEDND